MIFQQKQGNGKIENGEHKKEREIKKEIERYREGEHERARVEEKEKELISLVYTQCACESKQVYLQDFDAEERGNTVY